MRTGSGRYSFGCADLEEFYTWVVLASVRYVFVKPASSDTPQHLSHAAMATHTVTAWTLYAGNETGVAEAAYLTQGQRQEEGVPVCFTPEPETVIRAYLGDETVEPLCLAESVQITSVDGEVLTTIDPVAPDLPH